MDYIQLLNSVPENSLSSAKDKIDKCIEAIIYHLNNGDNDSIAFEFLNNHNDSEIKKQLLEKDYLKIIIPLLGKNFTSNGIKYLTYFICNLDINNDIDRKIKEKLFSPEYIDCTINQLFGSDFYAIIMSLKEDNEINNKIKSILFSEKYIDLMIRSLGLLIIDVICDEKIDENTKKALLEKATILDKKYLINTKLREKLSKKTEFFNMIVLSYEGKSEEKIIECLLQLRDDNGLETRIKRDLLLNENIYRKLPSYFNGDKNDNEILLSSLRNNALSNAKNKGKNIYTNIICVYSNAGIVYQFDHGIMVIASNGKKTTETFDDSSYHGNVVYESAKKLGQEYSKVDNSNDMNGFSAAKIGLLTIYFEGNDCLIFFPNRLTQYQLEELIAAINPRKKDFTFHFARGEDYFDDIAGDKVIDYAFKISEDYNNIVCDSIKSEYRNVSKMNCDERLIRLYLYSMFPNNRKEIGAFLSSDETRETSKK